MHRRPNAVPICERGSSARAALVDPLALLTAMPRRRLAEHRTHDLFFYPEGGRSYSGELKSPKTGLLIACLHAQQPELVVIPTAVAYDLVVEDHVLAHQKVKRRQRPFSRVHAALGPAGCPPGSWERDGPDGQKLAQADTK